MYNIVIQYSYTLPNDHDSNSSYNLPPYNVIIILLTIFAMLYIIMSYLFYNWMFLPVNLSHLLYSSFPPLPSDSTSFFLCIWVCFCFIMFAHLFVFLESTYKWNHTVFFFLWLISLSIIPSRSTHVVSNGKTPFSLRLSNIPHLLIHPSINGHFKLLPYLGYSK